MRKSEYDIDTLNRNLLPPPRIHPFTENWPIIEPPFRDQRPPYDQEAEEWETVESSPTPDDELMVLTDDALIRVREVVLRHERLQKLLADKRYISIGASLRENKESDSRPTILYVLYDYGENKVIEVTLDGSSLEVTDIATGRYQPPPVQEEIDRAIEIARTHENLAARLTDDLVGMGILVSADDPGDPRHNHRLFDIRFGCPDERLPRYSALVDLSAEKVIRSSIVNGLCGGDNHE